MSCCRSYAPFRSVHASTGTTSMLRLRTVTPAALLLASGLSYSYNGRGRLRADGPTNLWEKRTLYSTDNSRNVDKNDSPYVTEGSHETAAERSCHAPQSDAPNNSQAGSQEEASAFATFTRKFAVTKDSFGSIEWSSIGDSIKNYIVPEWARFLPETIQKLQRELSLAPGSLADDIWREARDVHINPEIGQDARVRVGDTLCPEEIAFRQERQKHAARALAKYLNIKEEEIHPDDVPIIAVCGSGGGLRALVAGTGSYLAAQEAGLWDCVTYTAGVSGSCWLQTLYHSTLTGRDFNKMVDHLKNRLSVHIAFPPKALSLLTTAPTNKYLLAGLVEKLKGDPEADFGLVDIYGLLLGARLLVPKGELNVSDEDLKLSNQRKYLRNGAHPLPIYTAVRHEIPMIGKNQEQTTEIKGRRGPEKLKEEAKKEAWFQWFEFTPYEFFCEEFNAGIPTWALGRHFNEGKNVVPPGEYAVPELRVPGLMGIWGSAFCATLSHYYKEIRPVVKGLAGFAGIDSLIEGKSQDLIRVHPIDPASIPNYVMGMKDQLPRSCPESIFSSTHLRLMDAGMSNNLPIYPLLRPGRNVDVVVAFDASADIKRENWLSVVDGYAKQRGVKGWPIGAGWPRAGTNPEDMEKALREPQNISEEKLDERVTAAQKSNPNMHDAKIGTPETTNASQEPNSDGHEAAAKDTDLSYCNVWVGTKQQRTSDDEPPPSKRLFHPQHDDHSESDFHLMSPDAGIAVIYFPLLPNPSAPELPSTSSLTKTPAPRPSEESSADVSDPTKPLTPHPSSIDPDVDDFLSTWNFVYTPEQIDAVIGLAKANFAVGEEQTKRVVRAVYERKKRDRLRREMKALEERLERAAEERKRLTEGFVPI
ncbi:hypothetical protein DTO164E3_8069 [Paecilomyces variotii]|nr:hypothetical protein DTO164E3_8069 [Paecilomyces variotii]KAJ9218492.1 hypothetical protein DTO169C6_9162 [Paecilomyces variotii]KAJ9264815.1 hypothetical protein DTO212C5_6931 [Paecilomyces variotii]KAJ9311915.1 hypothetical protein DTO271D3_7762 [Paecilomyces variotii]KAJ9348487.1 hypothetical protein DTO027B9_8223 [Paecilomyces variotii]